MGDFALPSWTTPSTRAWGLSAPTWTKPRTNVGPVGSGIAFPPPPLGQRVSGGERRAEAAPPMGGGR